MNARVPGSVQRAYRIATGALLAVHVMLAWRHLYAAAMQMIAPVEDHFFPALLRHPALMLVAFFAPVITECLALRDPTPRRMKRGAAVELLGAATLLIHQATYFYATWVVVFWVSVYLVWLAWSAASDETRAAAVGPFLAQLLIALLFLGGAAGKWTAGYWSGDAFHESFWQAKPYVVYAASLGFEPATIRLATTWLSRAAIVGETALALLVFMPARFASTAAIVAAIGLWLTSVDLFEVSWPLIGLAVAGRVLALTAAVQTTGAEHPAPVSS
jgi:hypothetical protein